MTQTKNKRSTNNSCLSFLNPDAESRMIRCLPMLVILFFPALSAVADDPLPSWNDSTSKSAVIEFVSKVCKPGSSNFIPQRDRVAVFDNDGTLWPENPAPFQFLYAVDRLKLMLPKHPELANDPMVKAALEGDVARLLDDHYQGLFHILGLTHAGMTTDLFDEGVTNWIATAMHPRFGREYDNCIYQPMRELLAYLRRNGFKTYIVSGGGADFMRVWAERVYGVPPEQTIGSRGQVKFEMRHGVPVFVKTLDNLFIDDKEGKPVGIHYHIGRRPVMAFGNSDGDKAMLEYTTIGNPYPSFGLIVHHTDAEREYAYDAKPSSTGKLIEALADAPKRGWAVVDMKKDWKIVLSDNTITAIDILLEPDQMMLDQAASANAELLGVFPDGFPLDATHRPHITLTQNFVRTADLSKVYAAAEKVLASYDLGSMEFEAIKHYYIPDGSIGLAGIVIRPTSQLVKLQEELLMALEPFTEKTGGSSAFITTPDDLVIDPALIAYIETFATSSAGKMFNPHVTTGVGPKEYLDKMLERPFVPFTFKAPKAAIYQLGQMGTAAKRLKDLK